MNKISGKKKVSVVKILVKGMFISVLLSSQISSAGENDSAKVIYGTPSVEGIEKQGENDLKLQERRFQEERDRENRQACKELRDKMDDVDREIGDACKRAGLGEVSGCVSRAKMCGETSGSDSFNTIGSFAKAFGIDGLTSIGSACPQMNGRDYFTEKEKLEKDIKDTEKELADLNDDQAEIEADYNKENQDIQKTLTEAQEDFKKKKLEIAQSDRERVSDFMNTQNQAKEELRKEGEKIIRLRGQLIQSQRDKALKMLAMSEAAGKRACMKAVKDAKKTYDSVPFSKLEKLMKEKRRKREDLINIYEDCMDAFDQQRIALNESKRQEQEELNNQIDSTQARMDEIQNSLNLADSQLKEMKEAASKEEADALQSVIDLGQRSQQQMKDAYDKRQKKSQTLAAKTQSLTAALNRINQSLMTLGPAPKRTSEDSVDEASSTISAQINILEKIKADSSCVDPKLNSQIKKNSKALSGTK